MDNVDMNAIDTISNSKSVYVDTDINKAWFENMSQIFNFSIIGTRFCKRTQDLSGRGQFNTPYGWCVTNGPLVMCCDRRINKLCETEPASEVLEMLETLRSAKYINLSRKDVIYAKQFYKTARKLWQEKSGEKRVKNTPEMRIQMQESNLFNFKLYRMPQGFSFSSVYLNDALIVAENPVVLALGLVPIYGKEIPIIRVWGGRGIVWLWPRHSEADAIATSVWETYLAEHAIAVDKDENVHDVCVYTVETVSETDAVIVNANENENENMAQ